MASLAAKAVPSFGFSGAGFLTCYHLGVAECLLKHGKLLAPGELPKDDEGTHEAPIMTGVSGGALVATAVSLGIRPEDGMKATMAIAEHTRKAGGLLDHLRPGFSLIDQVENAVASLVNDVDEEFALRRIDHGRLLRIGLTDSRAFPRFRGNPDAYVYVDHYNSLEEILAACILSSYIPGLTGPIVPTTWGRNGAVLRANEMLENMMEKGYIKNVLGYPVHTNAHLTDPVAAAGPSASNHASVRTTNNVRFWDGGLANLFPIIDNDTCVITPLTGRFINPSISPSPLQIVPSAMEYKAKYSRPSLCLENLRTIRYIAFSSEGLALEAWFEQGFNDANKFLSQGKNPSMVAARTFQVLTD